MKIVKLVGITHILIYLLIFFLNFGGAKAPFGPNMAPSLFLISNGKTSSSSGFTGAPTIMSFPCVFSRPSRGMRGCYAETVSMIPSNVPWAAYVVDKLETKILYSYGNSHKIT